MKAIPAFSVFRRFLQNRTQPSKNRNGNPEEKPPAVLPASIQKGIIMLVFRSSTLEDIDAMMEIVHAGIALLASQNIDQWQRGYPNRPLLVSDVGNGIGYVVIDTDYSQTIPVAMCAVTFGDEADYREIRDGNWLTGSSVNYATIHRGAVRGDCYGKGYSDFLFRSVEDMARKNGADSVRADTHPENIAMQKTMARNGYTPCGMITIQSGPEGGTDRIAYEKLL